MDVQEILTFVPDAPAAEKRSSTESDALDVKKQKVEDAVADADADPDTSTESDSFCEITKKDVRKLTLNLEKNMTKNQEMRVKFPEQPVKFMESELDLFDAIRHLSYISTASELIDENLLSTLLSLLTHENIDIVLAAVQLLRDIAELSPNTMLFEYIKIGLCPFLVSILEKVECNDEGERVGVYNILHLFEMLIDMDPNLAETTGFVPWLLKCICGPFTDNKQYGAELLAICLQDSVVNRRIIGASGGFDIILQQLALYKRQDPKSAEENEMMSNLFDCLCASLAYGNNKNAFITAEGLQLMNLMLKCKKMSRLGALKVINHALSAPNSHDVNNKFVEVLGLTTVFPLFMKPPKGDLEIEEYAVNIVRNLLRYTDGIYRKRVINKFLENDLEKVDRLMELHLKYIDKMNIVERVCHATSEEECYFFRLDHGLFTLIAVDYIILEICSSVSLIRQRVLNIVKIRDLSMKTIKDVMREYVGNLGDDEEGHVEKEMEEKHVLRLIDKF